MNQAQRLKAARRKARRTAMISGAAALAIYVAAFWWL